MSITENSAVKKHWKYLFFLLFKDQLHLLININLQGTKHLLMAYKAYKPFKISWKY